MACSCSQGWSGRSEEFQAHARAKDNSTVKTGISLASYVPPGRDTKQQLAMDVFLMGFAGSEIVRSGTAYPYIIGRSQDSLSQPFWPVCSVDLVSAITRRKARCYIFSIRHHFLQQLLG